MKAIGILGAVTLWGLLLALWVVVLAVGWAIGSLIQWREDK